MKTTISIIIFFISQMLSAQIDYGTPTHADIPKKLQHLKVAIEVMHFPKTNDPIKIGDKYYWKHATGILSKNHEITITEYGAYLFYNNKWNLRKSYPLKSLDKDFGTKKQVLHQGQPYVWVKNWRVDNKLFAGWAMWYFIGTTTKGETVCGYETINTTNNILN